MLKKIWDFFDGGKTTIGALILAAAPLLPEDWRIFAQIIGAALTGGGTVDKIRKAVKRKKAA